MPADHAAPRRITGFLAVLAAAAVLVFLLTLLVVARNLAGTFDNQARIDALQRIEHGLAAISDSLVGQANDYANWTDFHQAVNANDAVWLNENVGTALSTADQAQLVALGGGPLQAVHGWFDERVVRPEPDVVAQLVADGQQRIDSAGMAYGDRPLTSLVWLAGELWLLAQSPVWPHTFDPDPDAPTAVFLMGTRLAEQLPRNLGGGTLLLTDIRLQTMPGPAEASHALTVSGGPPAWVTWQLPAPGSDAIRAILLPVAFALVVLLSVLGAGIHVARRFAGDLERARAAAERASESKSRFLAQMSHEIRTPLNGVLGMAELLDDTPLDPDQKEMVQAIRGSGDSLLHLINEILDLARVESGRLVLAPAPFALPALLARIRDLHGVMAARKGIDLRVRSDLPPDQLRLGDEARLLQILHNVVGNAIKFTERGSVEVQVMADGDDGLVILVRDTGIGMTAEQVSRVFDPYEQAEATTARRFGGSGLGMAIVRSMIELMGGDITLTSAPGAGTEVRIALPLRRVSEDRRPEPAGAPSGARPPSLAGCRVLLADDSATNRRVLQLMLGKLGIAPSFAEDGVQACDLWKQQDFSLVLMDVEMPRMDGIEALTVMRDHSRAALRAEPRVIAVTANAMREQVESYLAAGFVDVLSKPVSRSALEETLNRHAGTARADATCLAPGA